MIGGLPFLVTRSLTFWIFQLSKKKQGIVPSFPFGGSSHLQKVGVSQTFSEKQFETPLVSWFVFLLIHLFIYPSLALREFREWNHRNGFSLGMDSFPHSLLTKGQPELHKKTVTQIPWSSFLRLERCEEIPCSAALRGFGALCAEPRHGREGRERWVKREGLWLKGSSGWTSPIYLYTYIYMFIYIYIYIHIHLHIHIHIHIYTYMHMYTHQSMNHFRHFFVFDGFCWESVVLNPRFFGATFWSLPKVGGTSRTCFVEPSPNTRFL